MDYSMIGRPGVKGIGEIIHWLLGDWVKPMFGITVVQTGQFEFVMSKNEKQVQVQINQEEVTLSMKMVEDSEWKLKRENIIYKRVYYFLEEINGLFNTENDKGRSFTSKNAMIWQTIGRLADVLHSTQLQSSTL